MVGSAAIAARVSRVNRTPSGSHLWSCWWLSLGGNLSPNNTPSPPALIETQPKMSPEWLPRLQRRVLNTSGQPQTIPGSEGSTGLRAGDAQAAAIWRPWLLQLSSGDGVTILVKRQCQKALVLNLWPKMARACTQSSRLLRRCVVRPPTIQAQARPTTATSTSAGSGSLAGQDHLACFDANTGEH